MAGSSKLTKTQIIAAVAEGAGVDKRTVSAVLDAIVELVGKQLGANGPGEIVLPGLVKLKAKTTPATDDRNGSHPITKQPMVIKGKPASRKVRATPIKALKDQVGS
jgi:DNA-binding protein HU-beta